MKGRDICICMCITIGKSVYILVCVVAAHTLVYPSPVSPMQDPDGCTQVEPGRCS